jgi:hypothetical protein
MHARSTQIKEEEDCKNEAETALDSGLKTHCVYAATVDAGQIYTGQTGRFPVVSSRGNTYIMVLYAYYGNAIMTEPIKNRTAVEHLRAFKVMEITRGLTPILMILDNEASQILNDYLYERNISFQLLPSYSHYCNAAECAIGSFRIIKLLVYVQ